MKELPKRAGEARLEFMPPEKIPGRGVAHRDKDTIFLEMHETTRFYPLLQGQQFLLTADDGGGNRILHFGGMDESPFLTQLNIAAFENLLDGEDAFFEGLKPRWIRQIEKETRKKARRQGDFFAFSPAKDLSTFLRSQMQVGNKAQVSLVDKFSVEGTRHTISGLHFELRNNQDRPLARGGEGVLAAPDHEPLRLDSPHIIIQALHLINPKEAD